MPRLTLTFDNGPHIGATDWILDLLAARSLKATFFVVAKKLADPERRKLAERAKAEGHWIGNHTLSHAVPLGLAEAGAHEREIGEAERVIGDLARPTPLFRPHGKGRLGPHLLSGAAADYLSRHRYTVVTWNSVPGDYLPPRGAWLPRAQNDLARDWTLMVLHDEHLDAKPLTALLDRARDGGVDIAQDFPPDCVAMRAGVASPGLEAIVTRDQIER